MTCPVLVPNPNWPAEEIRVMDQGESGVLLAVFKRVGSDMVPNQEAGLYLTDEQANELAEILSKRKRP